MHTHTHTLMPITTITHTNILPHPHTTTTLVRASIFLYHTEPNKPCAHTRRKEQMRRRPYRCLTPAWWCAPGGRRATLSLARTLSRSIRFVLAHTVRVLFVRFFVALSIGAGCVCAHTEYERPTSRQAKAQRQSKAAAAQQEHTQSIAAKQARRSHTISAKADIAHHIYNSSIVLLHYNNNNATRTKWVSEVCEVKPQPASS